jgi:hypothetical protein
MSTSTSSQSEVVLLWGDRWWLPGRAEPLIFGAVDRAPEILLRAWGDSRPAQVTIVCQPATLLAAATACPKGDRRLLREALAADLPVVTDASRVWSFEPILPQGEGFATVLYHESEPGLCQVVAQLRSAGLEVETAWPMATFLQSLARDWSDSGAFAAAVMDADRVAVYSHHGDGRRAFAQWTGPEAFTKGTEFLRAFQVDNPGSALWLALTNESVRSGITSVGPLANNPSVHTVTVAEALARPWALGPQHPAQLLPRPPRFSLPQAAWAASFAVLAASAWIAASYTRDVLAWRAEGATRETRIAALREEVTRLRANTAEIAALRAAVTAAEQPRHTGKFLARLSAVTPPSLVIRSLRISAGEFHATGYIAPDAPPGTWERWRETVGASAPWVLDPPGPRTETSPQWELRGRFTS